MANLENEALPLAHKMRHNSPVFAYTSKGIFYNLATVRFHLNCDERALELFKFYLILMKSSSKTRDKNDVDTENIVKVLGNMILVCNRLGGERFQQAIDHSKERLKII